MNTFLKATFTKPKLQKLFVSTALGNFAGYVAGSLVTVVSSAITPWSAARCETFSNFSHASRSSFIFLPEWLDRLRQKRGGAESARRYSIGW